MNRFGNVQLLLAGLAVLGLSCLTAGRAAAQFKTGFEPSDGYTAGTNVDGTTDLNLGATWYRPNGTADDPQLVDTFGGTLGLPQNPNPDINGGTNTQFIGSMGAGAGTFNRAQINFPWSTSTVWTISYDMLSGYQGTGTAANNISSFSLQPSDTNTAYMIQLNFWNHLRHGARWQAAFEVWTAGGSGPLLAKIKGKPARQLLTNHWYNIQFTIDLTANQITSVRYTNLKNGKMLAISPPNFYLQGGAGGGLALPTAFRFFTGGGSGTSSGNVAAFDNLSITPGGPGPIPGDAVRGTVEFSPVKSNTVDQ
jgi:hypothetical protein